MYSSHVTPYVFIVRSSSITLGRSTISKRDLVSVNRKCSCVNGTSVSCVADQSLMVLGGVEGSNRPWFLKVPDSNSPIEYGSGVSFMNGVHRTYPNGKGSIFLCAVRDSGTR